MSQQSVVTILTPTYNRVGGVLRLYDSLKKQTCSDFVWMIVDDGSTDETEKSIKEITENAPFQIIYTKKINGGKHTALNVGIKIIKTPLTFIVDSDDYLTADAVETIVRYHARYEEMEGLCGYSFLRQFPDGKINGKLFVPSEMIATYLDARINSGDSYADKAEVFITDCLREFPFPEYPDEKFLGEDIVWMRMSRKYRMVHINKAIYIGEYQDDGLTKNRRLHNVHSPNGCMNRAYEFMGNEVNIKTRTKATLQYVIYGKFAGKTYGSLLRNTKYKTRVLLLSPAAELLYLKWKREYR